MTTSGAVAVVGHPPFYFSSFPANCVSCDTPQKELEWAGSELADMVETDPASIIAKARQRGHR